VETFAPLLRASLRFLYFLVPPVQEVEPVVEDHAIATLTEPPMFKYFSDDDKL
jgi:hypothetical protein